MSGTLVRPNRFHDQLLRVFDDARTDWFVGFDRMLDDLSAKWEQAFKEFADFPRSEMVKHDDGSYTIKVMLPDFKKEDITVKTVGDRLVISADIETKTGDAEEPRETNRRSFHQSLLLADGMTVAKASFKDSELVVEVTAPAKQVESEHLIAIE